MALPLSWRCNTSYVYVAQETKRVVPFRASEDILGTRRRELVFAQLVGKLCLSSFRNHGNLVQVTRPHIYPHMIARSVVHRKCKCSFHRDQRYDWHSEEGGLYAANTGIKHTEEYDLYSESGHVNKQ